MPRRLASTALVLVIGWVLLLWGLAALERVFVRERADALAELERRRETLSLYAEASVRERVGTRMEAAARRMVRAVADPLEPAVDLILVEEGSPRLPRDQAPIPGDGTPAADLYAALRAGHVPVAEGDGPWVERLALFQEFRSAVREDRIEDIERTVRRVLAHRLHYRIDVTRELPYLLALLDLLSLEARPDPALMRGLLRHGMSDGQGGELRDLTRMLLENRARFTEPDFVALVAILAELSERAGIPAHDLRARATDLPAGPVVLPEVRAFLDGWYVEPTGEGSWRGLAMDLEALMEEVATEMRGRGLIEASASLIGAGPSSRATAYLALDALALEIRSDRWSAEARLHEQRFRLKTALVALSALLGLVLVALALALQRRRLRWVEMRADFVSAVTHELRTPLASIRLMAETLERRLQGSAEARDYPSRIVRVADGLAFLVENILSFNRLEKGRWVARRETVDLASLVATLIDEIREEAPRELRVDAAALEGLSVQADPELLRLLFGNLMRNAVLYNARDPIEISLEAQHDADGLRLRIRDNGWGLTEEERETVFEDFGRGQEAQRRAVPGTGLGLAICRRVLKLHGGSIRVLRSSQEGSTLELRLPRARPPRVRER